MIRKSRHKVVLDSWVVDQANRKAGTAAVSVRHIDGVFVRYHLVTAKSSVATPPTFVLIHGIGVSARYFVPLAHELSKYGNAILFDLPGFGGLPKPSEAMDIKSFARTVAATLKTLATEERISTPVVVLGHSMGAQVAMELARICPELVEAIMLQGAPVNARERSLHEAALRFLQSSAHEPIKLGLIAARAYLLSGVAWFLETLPAMMNFAIEDRIEEYQGELVISRGEYDSIAPRGWLAELCSSRGAEGRTRLVEVSGGAHSVIFKYADVVADELAQLAHARSRANKWATDSPSPWIQLRVGDYEIAEGGDLPPLHKLRQVVETATDYALGALVAIPRAVAADFSDAPDQVSKLSSKVPLRGPLSGLECWMLPGVWEQPMAMSAIARDIVARGGKVRMLPQLKNMLGPVPDLAKLVEERLRETDARGIVLVAHSKGGLVGRRVLAGPEGQRVRAMVSLGAPFRGSPLANGFLGTASHTSDLRPSGLEAEWQSQSLPQVDARIIAISARWDEHVPPTELPGAQNVVAPTIGHMRLLTSKQARALVIRALTAMATPRD
ncbi:alpha/beta fold hydrolase [Winkia neuii]|uniref:alpha/beta fold hydrolase n=1 Tax=Winkia neuii TaxID=33007 RepID=UPI0004267620|nr:alpha/beta fold hydrolase [Winkia neuii]